MEINCTYPEVKQKTLYKDALLNWIRIILIAGGIISLSINLAVGGKLWFIIVFWSIWMVYSELIYPDLVSYNRISQFIKFVINACVLLILINYILSPLWLVGTVPSICFGSLIIVGFLFFTDLRRQKDNMLPIFNFIILCIAGSIVGLSLNHENAVWPLATMLGVSISLLVALVITLGGDFIRECKKIFSVR